MRSKCITTWPMPSGPVRKPEMLRPGLNGSVVVCAPWKISSRLPAGSLSTIKSSTWRSPASARNFGAGRLDARRYRVERRGVGDLPAEEGDALPAVGVHHEPLLAIIHAEGEARAALVDALQAEEVFAVARPVAHVLGANPDIAQRLDAHDGPRSLPSEKGGGAPRKNRPFADKTASRPGGLGQDSTRAHQATDVFGFGPFRPSCMLPSLRHSSPDVSVRAWTMARSMTRLALLLAATVLFTAGKAAAQSVSEFYAGRQITFIVGASAGGGYDRQARLVARHLGKHIPGTPTIIVQNMPGAGSLAATNYIYNAAAKDGSVIALVMRSMLLIRNWNPQSVRFDLVHLNWIGSINSEVALVAAWHTAPHKSANDLFEQELIVGGTTGVDPETTPRLLNALIGTKFKIVNGYPGTTEIILAMERGELQGIGDWSWSSMKTARPDWLREKKITLLMQAALHKEPELADLPSALDFVKNDADRKVMELYLTQKTLARPLIVPPGVAPERLTALKAAFAALAHDDDFLADARTTGIDVAPIAGEAVDRIIAMISSAPPETTERLGKAIGSEK